MNGTSRNHEVDLKAAPKAEHQHETEHKARPSREDAFLQIREFDQATRKRVKNRVY